MSDLVGIILGGNPCQQLKEQSCEDGELHTELWEPLFKNSNQRIR